MADLDQRRQLMVVPDQHEHAGTPQGTQASLQPGERGKREKTGTEEINMLWKIRDLQQTCATAHCCEDLIN